MDSYYQGTAMGAIAGERMRQERLKSVGRFEHTLDESGLTPFEKLATIVEEVGEVAQECLALSKLTHDTEGSTANLKKELTQIAALACAWVEGIIAEEVRASAEARLVIEETFA